MPGKGKKGSYGSSDQGKGAHGAWDTSQSEWQNEGKGTWHRDGESDDQGWWQWPVAAAAPGGSWGYSGATAEEVPGEEETGKGKGWMARPSPPVPIVEEPEEEAGVTENKTNSPCWLDPPRQLQLPVVHV